MPKPPVTTSAWSPVIQQASRNGALIVSPAGRLGSLGSGTLSEALGAAMDQGHRKIVLDLTDVDYISSAGLLALEAALGRMHQEEGELVLCGVGEPVRLALDLAGLLPRVAVHDTLDDAVARVAVETAPPGSSR
jgi:stage II sporulation protein AA (anti-sigma F factor antagonist)